MMVANHFDVRWVDGYSAVSDVPSSLAATIEKLAAELPSSHDRIELAVRDVRTPDGSTVWVGLLRFVVAVSSAPRPLGFLHAAVLPAGYAVDLPGWRALVARRYGEHPENRIRTLYEELAEATKDIGRDRLHALAIRPEDVRELLEPLEGCEPSPVLPRAHARPGSRPGSRPKSGYPRPPSTPGAMPAPAAPANRISQAMLPLSMRVIELPEPPDPLDPLEPPAPPDTEELPEQPDQPDQPDQPELSNDVTQPMDVPSSTAAPLSGEHPEHPEHLREEPRRPRRPPRAWWVAGATVSALALLLGAVAWLAHRHGALVEQRDRLAYQLEKQYLDRAAWERDRTELEQVKRELLKRRAADSQCTVQVEEATRECKESLADSRNLGRERADRLDKLQEEGRLRSTELQSAKDALAKLKTDLNLVVVSKDRAEQLHREEQGQIKELRTVLTQRDEQLSALCRRLQSAPGGSKPPSYCQGIK